jgi:hypothetical protein
MLGDELQDLREDLSGLPLASRIGVDEVRETEGLEEREPGLSGIVGDGKGEERGKGTAAAGADWGSSKDERNFDLSRKGGKWACSSSSWRLLVLIVSFVGRGSSRDSSGESSSSPSWKVGRFVRRRVGKAPREAKAPVVDVLASDGGGTIFEKDRLCAGRP